MSEARRTRRARPVLAVVMALALFVPLAGAGHGAARTHTDAGASRASVGRVPARVESIRQTLVPTTGAPSAIASPTSTSSTTAAPAARVAAVDPPAATTTTTTPAPRAGLLNVVEQLARTVAGLIGGLTAPLAAPPTTLSPTTTTTLPVTTTTTVVACRNSTDPACGPFRFDPQPGADRPMTVQVVTEPATPRAGQEMVFRITLTDPDGVSHGSSLYFFGDSGLAETSQYPCAKFGPWDPPARDTAHAVEVLTARHTYASPGTYQTSFAFDAGPFDCTDSVTGRGDRPYASSATGTLTVVVAP